MQIESMTLPVGTTLDRFILRNQHAFPFATGELSQLLRDISLAAKVVNREINRAALANITGGMDSFNVQGESQQKLDVIADIRFMRALKNGGQVAAIVSEENEDIIYTGNQDAKYIVAIDPLDGSSNIDVNISIGTIFSIYQRQSPVGEKITAQDFFQGGRMQVAAGYVLYGPTMILVYSTGKGVNAFTYEQTLGDFILSHKEISIPAQGNIVSCNQCNCGHFNAADQQYLNHCCNTEYSSRYLGSLVGDIHRNMLKGGIYLYPATRNKKEGKLRLLYECFPMAYLVEQAGGDSTNGRENILDIKPLALHQRAPFIAGSSEMVKEYVQIIERANQACKS